MPMLHKPLLIYVAGPYSNDDRVIRDKNIGQARDAMAILLRAGHIPYCPHTHTARMEDTHPDIDYNTYLLHGLHILGMCDMLFLVGDYENSDGTTTERECAEEWEIPECDNYDQIPPVVGYPTATELTD